MSAAATSPALALLVQEATDRLARLAWIAAPPVLRVALAVPFFRSGLTKWDGVLSLSPAAIYLFEDEFKLHLFGRAYDFPWPAAFAYFDGVAEIVLPVLLMAGLATRISALMLLVMTAIIQLVVPEGWANFHLPWAAMILAIIALGPGPLSLDHLVASFRRKAEALDEQ
ncbi:MULTISPECIES: DoxX family protein [unclassified Bradyrhizobium]|uniref:DoxX family protein n=1 Tax=unclassified Bradyrhizobium TaxID=2631580 RepID=UPI0028E32A26|nr:MULTISPECIES: DoxX family protein [unclassified Bradyrhizobium]